MKKIGFLTIFILLNVASIGIGLAANAAATPDKLDKLVEATGIITPIDVDKLKSGEQTLKVGHYDQLPPFYFTSNDQHGFGYDVFMEVAKRAGIKNVTFIGFDNTTDLNNKLRQGKIDVIANAWDLPGMRKQFLLTAPYYTQGGLSFLYFQQKGSFQTADDLKGHTVGVFAQGYADRYWLPSHSVAKNSIKTYETIKDLMFALKDGDIDVAVVYYPLARLAQQQLKDQLASTLVQSINDVYALRKQDTALQNILNQALQTLASDGMMAKIQAQYLDAFSTQAAEKTAT